MDFDVFFYFQPNISYMERKSFFQRSGFVHKNGQFHEIALLL